MTPDLHAIPFSAARPHLQRVLEQVPGDNYSREEYRGVMLSLGRVERFCNLSFGSLNSFVFICPGRVRVRVQKKKSVNHSVIPTPTDRPRASAAVSCIG